LHAFARHDRPVPAKGWDEAGPDHPFLSVRIQVPLRPCIAVAFPPQALSRNFLPCFALLLYMERKAMYCTQRRATLFRFVWPRHAWALCSALLYSVHLAWLVVWLSCFDGRAFHVATDAIIIIILTGNSMMMMMMLHQLRHGRQDNHATNHARCVNGARHAHCAVIPGVLVVYHKAALSRSLRVLLGCQQPLL
jgi:hypothetical protein